MNKVHNSRPPDTFLKLLSYLEMETFDETLDRNIWSLSDKRLKWDLEIATKRRTKPPEMEGILKEVFEQRRSSEVTEMEAKGDNDGMEQDETDRKYHLS
jgi:hypothetical protein